MSGTGITKEKSIIKDPGVKELILINEGSIPKLSAISRIIAFNSLCSSKTS